MLINGEEYKEVDFYEYPEDHFDEKSAKKRISILEKDGKYYVNNYEGMGMFIGPFASAIKTGDNGEVLVRDIGQDYYYVHGIEGEKPYGVGFVKEYNSDVKILEPYTYDSDTYRAMVKLEDGFHVKYSTGHIDPEAYSYYHKGDNIEIFTEAKTGVTYGTSGYLKLNFGKINTDNPNFNPKKYTQYAWLNAYANYVQGAIELREIPLEAFSDKTFVIALLSTGRNKVKKLIALQEKESLEKLKCVTSTTENDKILKVQFDTEEISKMIDEFTNEVVELVAKAKLLNHKRDQISNTSRESGDSLNARIDYDSIMSRAQQGFESLINPTETEPGSN